MEPDRAKDIIRSLADGRDPATGQQFPPDSPYQQADTVRALYMALEALSSAPSAPPREKSPRRIDPNRPKLGTAWTPEEEQQLREEFQAAKAIVDIAQAHGRTAGAITSRLAKLGLIDEDPFTRRGSSARPMRLPSEASAKEGPTSPSDSAAPTPAPRELTEEEKDNLPF